ncbi:MAG: carbon-nitrogen hydrolase family protein [Pseudomonadota bacterium]
MIMPRTLKIAAAQYPLDFLKSADAYRAKISRWVAEAANRKAELLVFPEYGSMELAALGGKERAGDLRGSLETVSEHLALQFEVHKNLATQFGVTIVAASGPQIHDDQKVTNVARIFSPSGKSGEYHKRMPTPWERDPWGISAGPADGLVVFDLGTVKVGLVICYDIEFPLIGRALAEAGAEIILAPSNTETEHGYWRVRTGCMARALENQVYTVHSPTVGNAPWCPAVDTNHGAAGVFAPSDKGFAAGGVIALGDTNKPQWIYSDLNLDLLQTLRESGGVQTFNHWKEQPGASPLPQARMIELY